MDVLVMIIFNMAEVEEGSRPRPEDSKPYRSRPKRLSSQDLDRHQQKPRDDRFGGSESLEHEPVGCGQ